MVKENKSTKKLTSKKLRYIADPEYRRKRIEAAKTYYANNKKILLEDCREGLDQKLVTYGTERLMGTKKQVEDGKGTPTLSYNAQEFGELVGWAASNVYRKWNEKLLPKPTRFAIDFDKTKKVDIQKVYTKEQARDLVLVLGEHFTTIGYYRPKHASTRRALFKAVK